MSESTCSADTVLETFKTVTIVGVSLVLVGEDFVGEFDLFELLFGLLALVALDFVGMVNFG